MAPRKEKRDKGKTQKKQGGSTKIPKNGDAAKNRVK